jgi:hypothetical protein
MNDQNANVLGLFKGAVAAGGFYAWTTQIQGTLPANQATMQYAALIGGSAYAADRIMAMDIIPGESILEKKQLGMYGLSGASLLEAGLASGILWFAYPQVFQGFTPSMQSLAYSAAFDVLGSAAAPIVKAAVLGETV